MTANRTWMLVGISLALVIGFFVLREHWSHALGLAPYLLLFACPLLHLFHGHGGHGRHGGHREHRDHDDGSRPR